MTEEFDEDVVFENSPLFHYLQDLGHTDFEACPTVSQEDESDGGEGGSASPRDSPPKPSGGRLWRLAEAMWRRTPLHQAAASHRLEQQLDGVFGQYSVRCILEQDVLLQEDVELIELLDPGLLALGSSPPPSGSAPRHAGSAPLPRPCLLAAPSHWDVAALVGVAAVLLGLLSLPEGAWLTLAAVPWGVASLGWAAARGGALWRLGRTQRAAHERAAELRALVMHSKALTGLARKALRLVQETEVISRGFTLVSAAASFSRAGPGAGPRGQQLIGLRKAVYRALRPAFRASRRATCHMLKAYPLSSEIDNVTNYVSAVPLKELGLGLGLEHLSDEQAQELTDDFSLPALKVLFQLWVGQSSECFRRLALLLSPRRPEEPSLDGDGVAKGEAPAPPPPPLHSTIATVTEPLHHALASCLGELQRSYDFHRYFETQPRPQSTDRAGRARDKCRELNTLHTSVRSLQLHLKALLNEMIILEDDLEKLMVSRPVEPVEVTCSGYRELSERLRLLQPHMQASAGCWDDAVGQVERMLRRANNCPGTPEGPEQSPPPPAPRAPPPPQSYTLLIQNTDPVPEEQELEAYVSSSDSDEEWRASACAAPSPGDRERQRREGEESRRVLSELKAVLGLRASEGERRKWKQLLFNDQAALTPLVAGDNASGPSDAAAAASVGVAVAGAVTGGDGDNLSSSLREKGEEQQKKKEAQGEEEEEEEEGGARDDPPLNENGKEAEPAAATTEFSCGREEEEAGGAGQGAGGGSPASDGPQLYQFDGVVPEEGAGQNGPDCPPLLLRPRIPALSVTDRLTELHGSAAISFSSALAAQVAARSHAFAGMEEQTFGDEEEEEEEDEEEEEEEEEGDGEKTPEGD